ncbi:MAG TPA: tetratricopeptide repeat protein [Patescibacteria group bacterium]|nr:tetratricopeptide repeat protein [Patescibacteria group bacterium]
MFEQGYIVNDSGHPGYRVQGLLGKGGGAEVYFTETPTGFPVVIKAFANESQNGLMGGEDVRNGFEIEKTALERLSALQHPYVVPYYGSGFERGRRVNFVALGYARDGSMKDVVSVYGRFQQHDLPRYIYQAASALQAAHGKGIIHCDVKLGNLLLNEGNLWLNDFDIALISSLLKGAEPAKHKELRGTVFFMAPEQFRNKASSFSDQYGLAVTDYWSAVGETPFRIPKSYEKEYGKLSQEAKNDYWLELHETVEPPSFTQKGLSGPIPEEGWPVVRRGMAPKQEDRYATVEDYGKARINAYLRVLSEPEQPVGYISISSTVGNLPNPIVADQMTVVTLPERTTLGVWQNPRNQPRRSYNVTQTEPNVSQGDVQMSGDQQILQLAPPDGVGPMALLSKVWRKTRSEVREIRAGQDLEEVNREVEQGNILLRSNNPVTALKAYERALKIDPSNKVALDGKLEASGKVGDLNGMLSAVDALIQIEPDDVSHHEYRGDILFKMKEYPTALAAYDQAIALAPHEYYFLQRGDIFTRMFRFEDALVEYDKATALNPGNYEPSFRKGKLLTYMKKYEEALQVYAQILSKNKANISVLVSIGEILEIQNRLPEALKSYNIAYSLNGHDKSLAKRIQSLEKSVSIQNKRDSMNLVREAKELEDKDQLTEALGKYDEAIKIFPENKLAYFNIGNVSITIDEHEAALEAFEKAIQIDPQYIDALKGKGDMLRQLMRPDEALAVYEQALQACQYQDSVAWMKKGFVLLDLQRYEEALIALTSSLRVDNPNKRMINYPDVIAAKTRTEGIVHDIRVREASALVLSGLDYESLEQYDDALEQFDRAAQLDPENIEAHLGRGNALNELGRYQEAMSSHDKVIALNPENDIAFFRRGEAHHHLQRYSEALQDFDRALDLNPVDIWAMNGKGNVQLQQKQYQEALDQFNLALSLNPNNWMSIMYRGDALRLLGKPTEAYEEYKRALDIEPRRSRLHSCIGYAYLDMKDYHNALQAFENALLIDPNNAEASNGEIEALKLH